MSDQPDNPAVTLLRRMDALADEIAQCTASLRQQAVLLEGQYANIARRMDHIESRLERIARGLERTP